MKTNFTKSATNFGCYGLSKASTYLPNETFNIDDILNANVSLKDKAWFIRNNCEFTTEECREFAIGCALCVLPIYEAKYPDNEAPRKAIEAAKAYLLGTIGIDELRECRRAAAYAYAAYAYAADAAYAAAAAAAAAYDAYAADAADAYAADAAAAYDAYAADAYDADAENVENAENGKIPTYQDLLLQFFKDFTKVKETV